MSQEPFRTMAPPMNGPYPGGHPGGHHPLQPPLSQAPRAAQPGVPGGYPSAPPLPLPEQQHHQPSYVPPPWHQPQHLQQHHHPQSHPQHHHLLQQQQQLVHIAATHPGHPGHGHHALSHMHLRQPPPPLSLAGPPAPHHGHGYYGQGPPNGPLPSPGALSAPGSMGPPTNAATASPTYPGYPPHSNVRHSGSLPPPYLHPPHSVSSASSVSLSQPVSNSSSAGSAAYPVIQGRAGRAASIPADVSYRSPPSATGIKSPSSAPSSAPPVRPRLLSPDGGTLTRPESSSSSPSTEQSVAADPSSSASSPSSTPTTEATRASESATDAVVTVTMTTVSATAGSRSLRARRASSITPASTAVDSSSPATTARKRTAASRSPTRSSARLQSTTLAAFKDLAPPAARTRRGASHLSEDMDGGAGGGGEDGESQLDIEGNDPPVGPSGRAGRSRLSGRRTAAVTTAAAAGDSPATSSLPDVSAADPSVGVAFAGDSSVDPGATPLLGDVDPTSAATAVSIWANDSALPTLGTTGYSLEVVCRREPYMYFVASNFTEVTSRNLKKRTAADISAIHVDDRAGAIWVCFDIQRVYSEFDNLTMPCKQSLCSLFRRALDGPEGPDAGATIYGWAAIAEEASEVVRKTGEMVLARDLNRKAAPRRTGYVTVIESVGASPVAAASGATTRRAARIDSRSPSPEIITSYKRRRVSGDKAAAGSSSNGGHHTHRHGAHASHHHQPGALASASATSTYHPYSRSSPPLRSINPLPDPTTAYVMPPDTSVEYTQVLANEFSATLQRVMADMQSKYTELRNICTALHAENNELRAANGGAPDTTIRELTAAKDRIAKLEHENATLEAKLREQAVTIDSVRKLLWAAGNRPDI